MVKPFKINVIFWKVGYPNIFSGNICCSVGKQTIHKVSAAFIVKSCHPRAFLIEKESIMLPMENTSGTRVVSVKFDLYFIVYWTTAVKRGCDVNF